MTPEEQAVIDAARTFIATDWGVAHRQAENVLWAALQYLDVQYRPPSPEVPLPIVGHLPHRGSDVEAWIKRHRDDRDGPTSGHIDEAWYAFDELLDDYRDHADTGTPLGQDVAGPHPEED